MTPSGRSRLREPMAKTNPLGRSRPFWVRPAFPCCGASPGLFAVAVGSFAPMAASLASAASFFAAARIASR